MDALMTSLVQAPIRKSRPTCARRRSHRFQQLRHGSRLGPLAIALNQLNIRPFVETDVQRYKRARRAECEPVLRRDARLRRCFRASAKVAAILVIVSAIYLAVPGPAQFVVACSLLVSSVYLAANLSLGCRLQLRTSVRWQTWNTATQWCAYPGVLPAPIQLQIARIKELAPDARFEVEDLRYNTGRIYDPLLYVCLDEERYCVATWLGEHCRIA